MAKRKATPKSQSPPSGMQAAALASVRVPNARESKDPYGGFSSALPVFTETFSGFPGDSARRLIGVLRYLASFDEDAATTLRQLQAAVNTGLNYEFQGGTRAKKQAEAEVWAWGSRVYAGGLSGLINNQVRESFVGGATSLEWVPQRNREGVREVVPVPRETVSIRRGDNDDLIYEQALMGRTVELSPVTYRYVPVETEADKLHGVPLALAAIEALDRKRTLLTAEQRIIKLKEKLALVVATLPMPSPSSLGYQTTDDEGYADAAGELLSTYVNLLVETGDKLGVYAGWETADGKPNIQSTPTDQNVQGLGDLTKSNQHRAWNGLGIPPFLAGEMGSTNYALARVVMPSFYTIADNIQRAILAQIEHGVNLHLRLAGIPAKVWVSFKPRPSAFEDDEATARETRAKTDTLLYKLLGEAYIPTLAANWDVSVDDLKKALKDKPEPPDPPEGGDDGEQ